MNKINYDNLMQEVIEKEKGNNRKLLLHACCAPCASGCLDKLIENFEVVLYFYNPNMDTMEEYNKRAKEIERLAERYKIKYIIEEYGSGEFIKNVTGLEKEAEGGKRCVKCFSLRLKKTCEYAENNGYDYFTTTLTVSPLKNAQLINSIGEETAKGKRVKFLPSDFKKRNGYINSIKVSNELNLYRQNYCGCIYSKDNKGKL